MWLLGGPFVLINVDKNMPGQQKVYSEEVGNEWLGCVSEILSTNGIGTSLQYAFCDNYLDGGYHVPYAHGGLASGLKLDSYSTHIYEKVSIQRCDSAPESGDFDRLGSKALYAFIYPNFMIKRYGPWLDSNLALPLGHNKCQVIFDYFLDSSLMNDKGFIERSLRESEKVQDGTVFILLISILTQHFSHAGGCSLFLMLVKALKC